MPDLKNGQPIDAALTAVSAIMKTGVISIRMDATLETALEVCAEKEIRHLPVVDEQNRLVGILTDRDIRRHLSPRLGTLSENGSDRASLQRHIHVLMARHVVTGTPEMSLAEAARKLLHNRVGCLPIVDAENLVVGIVTSSDFLQLLAESAPADRFVPHF
jgi:acetoin utilization protein AcuB